MLPIRVGYAFRNTRSGHGAWCCAWLCGMTAKGQMLVNKSQFFKKHCICTPVNTVLLWWSFNRQGKTHVTLDFLLCSQQVSGHSGRCQISLLGDFCTEHSNTYAPSLWLQRLIMSTLLSNISQTSRQWIHNIHIHFPWKHGDWYSCSREYRVSLFLRRINEIRTWSPHYSPSYCLSRELPADVRLFPQGPVPIKTGLSPIKR